MAREKRTYVDEIREIRQQAGIAAIRIIDMAERLGVPRKEAKSLAKRILLYELTPEEAEAKLRELAEQAKK